MAFAMKPARTGNPSELDLTKTLSSPTVLQKLPPTLESEKPLNTGTADSQGSPQGSASLSSSPHGSSEGEGKIPDLANSPSSLNSSKSSSEDSNDSPPSVRSRNNSGDQLDSFLKTPPLAIFISPELHTKLQEVKQANLLSEVRDIRTEIEEIRKEAQRLTLLIETQNIRQELMSIREEAKKLQEAFSSEKEEQQPAIQKQEENGSLLEIQEGVLPSQLSSSPSSLPTILPNPNVAQLQTRLGGKPSSPKPLEKKPSQSDEENSAEEDDSFAKDLAAALDRAAQKDTKPAPPPSQEATERDALIPKPRARPFYTEARGNLGNPLRPGNIQDENNFGFVLLEDSPEVPLKNFATGSVSNYSQVSMGPLDRLWQAIKNWRTKEHPQDHRAQKGKGKGKEKDEESTEKDQQPDPLHPNQDRLEDESAPLLLEVKKGPQDSAQGNPPDLSRDVLEASKRNSLILLGSDDDPEKGDRRFVISEEDIKSLSPETRAFLVYLKDRVIDGKLNKKQVAGILGGIITGGAVSTPLITIFIGGILELRSMISSQIGAGNTPIDEAIGPIIGGTLGLDAASRGSAILIELLENSTQSFSRQKSKEHMRVLALAKGGIYAGAVISGALPLYYFYINTLVPDNPDDKDEIPKSYNIIFGTLAPFLVFDTILQYGHQLTQEATRKVNTYFYKAPLSPNEAKRKEYLAQFKELKHMVYGLDDDDLSDLYENVLVKGLNKGKHHTDFNPENLKVEEALRILYVLKEFHSCHKENLPNLNEEDKPNTWSSRIGKGVAIAATVGRAFVFWYIIETMCIALGIPEIASQILGGIFGALVGNTIQGIIEKDAVQTAIYDLSRSKKIPSQGTSHKPLRVGIKLWDYILQGPFNTLPYVLVGLDATSSWPLWARILTLLPFGVADSFNNATTFNQSYFNVVDGADCAVAYCYPFMGYKKDKIIRALRQTRRLFKELDPVKLEEIDSSLQKSSIH